MKNIGILHISDLHIVDANNPVIPRCEAISAAVAGLNSDIEACFIVMTGDIAFSGKKEQYEVAESFFNSLQEYLKTRLQVPIHFVSVPGNHDCDFSLSSSIRTALTPHLIQSIEQLDGDSFTAFLKVQDNYENFATKFMPTRKLQVAAPIYATQNFTLSDGSIILFNLYNSAWCSQLKEQSGTLVFPIHYVKEIVERETRQNLSLSVSLFHHPAHWLESNNQRKFRQLIDLTSDIVLTGHEHHDDAYQKNYLLSGNNVQYLEGGALFEPEEKKSRFNFIEVSLEENVQRIYRFQWNAKVYQPYELEPPRLAFLRNSELAKAGFNNKEDFAEFLHTPGNHVIHPQRKGLALVDIYIPPDLTDKSFERKLSGGSFTKSIQGDETLTWVNNGKRCIVIGPPLSGRSSFAKRLYVDFQQEQKVPLLAHGTDFKSVESDGFLKALKQAFKRQYNDSKWVEYSQLPREKRTLIIDDFDQSPLSHKTQHQTNLISKIENFFDTSVFLVSDVFALSKFGVNLDESSVFNQFCIAEIQEWGYQKRSQLIRRWLALGSEYNLTDSEFVGKLSQFNGIVDSAISNGLMPQYPFWVLSILQLWGTGDSQARTGSYGSLYEELIIRSLRKVRKSETNDSEAKYTYISQLAYHLLKEDTRLLTPEMMQHLHRKYLDSYEYFFDFGQLVQELEEAQILRRRSDGWVFSNKYCYFFFVARYYQENWTRADISSLLQSEMSDMVDRIYYEDYADIAIFFVYLSKDLKIIEHLIKNAAKIYQHESVCDVARDGEFVEALMSKSYSLAMPEGDVIDNNEQQRKRMDDQAVVKGRFKSGEDETARNVIYDDSLDAMRKLTIALRMIETLGQIVRNFPGSLTGDLKEQLVGESYFLGLRTLKALLSYAKNNQPELADYFIRLIKEKRCNVDQKPLTDNDLQRESDEIIVWLTTGVTFSIIKRITQAVGHAQLEPIYQRIESKNHENASIQLIDLSIRLEHFIQLPLGNIKKLQKRFSEHKFPHSILRDLVWHRLYLFPTPVQDKQQLGEMFKFIGTDRQLLYNKQMKLTPGNYRKKK